MSGIIESYSATAGLLDALRPLRRSVLRVVLIPGSCRVQLPKSGGILLRKFKKPPQGITSIGSNKKRSIGNSIADNMCFAAAACMEFPLLSELGEAKRAQNFKELGRLIPLCKKQFVEKFGEDGKKMFERVFRGL